MKAALWIHNINLSQNIKRYKISISCHFLSLLSVRMIHWSGWMNYHWVSFSWGGWVIHTGTTRSRFHELKNLHHVHHVYKIKWIQWIDRYVSVLSSLRLPVALWLRRLLFRRRIFPESWQRDKLAFFIHSHRLDDVISAKHVKLKLHKSMEINKMSTWQRIILTNNTLCKTKKIYILFSKVIS